MISLRKAVNEKCKECVFDDTLPGTWRKQVDECCGYSCPLYEVRPRSAYGKVRFDSEKAPKRTETAAVADTPLP